MKLSLIILRITFVACKSLIIVGDFMSLILKVTSVSNQSLQTHMEYEFNESGGTIGRKSSNTWVLPDEHRHLSGSHASIEYRDGKYHLVDTSTNGVFINGNDKPLGKGNKEQLEDGFQLLMGTFNIQVQMKNEVISKIDSPNDIPSEIVDDLFSDLLDDSNDKPNENLFEPLNEVDDTPSMHVGSEDPFFDFDDFNATSGSQAIKKEPVIETNQSEMDSFFKPAKVSQFSTKDPFEEDDNQFDISANKENSFVDANEGEVGIPDDWSLSDPKESPFDDLLSGFDKSLEKDKEDTSVADVQGEAHVKEIPSDSSLPIQSNSVDENLKSKAFLKGLGFDDNSFENGLSEEQLFIAGKLFRRAIEGTVDVLQSRAEIKNEMRMDMTTIQPIQNNPIKFAISTDEAIRKLLTQDNKSYMDPVKAMDEVYDDITSHQIAIISGIQASLSYVLKRFEPKNLITRFEEDNPISSSIPIHRKAKLWEAFDRLYGDIETEAEDDFNRLFGQEFSKAYDQQVEILKKKRAK